MIVNVGEYGRGKRVLYDTGNEKNSFSGGWEVFAPAWAGTTAVMLEGETASTNRQNPVGCTKEDSNLKIWFKLPRSQYGFANGAFGTVNNLDLSGFTTLHATVVRAQSVGGWHYTVLGVTNSKTPPADGTNTPPGVFADMTAGEVTLDISDLSSGFVYIGGMTRSGTYVPQFDEYADILVSKIWLT